MQVLTKFYAVKNTILMKISKLPASVQQLPQLEDNEIHPLRLGIRKSKLPSKPRIVQGRKSTKHSAHS